MNALCKFLTALRGYRIGYSPKQDIQQFGGRCQQGRRYEYLYRSTSGLNSLPFRRFGRHTHRDAIGGPQNPLEDNLKPQTLKLSTTLGGCGAAGRLGTYACVGLYKVLCL